MPTDYSDIDIEPYLTKLSRFCRRLTMLATIALAIALLGLMFVLTLSE